jgi:ATP-dependent helicase HrpB
MSLPPAALPIWQIHPDILASLRVQNRLVLIAPTGSGKTTQVPQMLLDSGLVPLNGKVVVLQPRRVAARTVAARVAFERGVRLGQEVGYQIRFEDQTSVGTRINFVTEGILLRWLQDDQQLRDVSCILFDEFHERNLLSDVALGLVKEIQKTARPDLKIVVMSATLEAEPVAAYLGGCPVLRSEGQAYSVEVEYLKFRQTELIHEQAARKVEAIINSEESGDILVFMPGMGEIHATIAECRHLRINERLALIPLHGDLPPDEQDRAFAPNELRKVVVSTNVAETSVTIDGIRHVVDSGLARISRYDAERGISTLFIEEISRASADQRKGRAGRTAPGTCHRLWTESGHLNRPEKNTPEIQRADLAETVLLLHSMGVRKAAEFDWLDKPNLVAVERAENLLRLLGALDAAETASGTDITPLGRNMLKLPMHPRYSRMLIEAAGRGCLAEAALCAALVSGRDLLVRLSREDKHTAKAREQFENNEQSDFFVLIQAFEYARRSNFDLDACKRLGIHAVTARQVALTFQQLLEISAQHKWLQRAELKGEKRVEVEALQRAIMTGFIDQLCVRKDKGSLDCLLTERRTGTLARESVVQNAPMFVTANIREISAKSGDLTLLGLATAVRLEWIQESFPQHLSTQIEHVYDRTHKRVAAIKITRFRDLVLAQEHQRELDPALSGRALASAHLEGAFELPLLNHELKQFIARVNLVCKAAPELEFPAFTKRALLDRLGVAFAGLTLAKEAQAKEIKTAIHKQLAAEQQAWLDELAPLILTWPDGRKLKLLYPDNDPASTELALPEVNVKLHECFPLTEHPMLCEGKVPVKLWLCTPDGKRLEPTTNWPKFRAESYPKLKPNLSRKFPGFTWL